MKEAEQSIIALPAHLPEPLQIQGIPAEPLLSPEPRRHLPANRVLGFVQEAIALGVELDIEERDLLGTVRYLATDQTQMEVARYFGVTTRAGSSLIVRRTLRTLWEQSPIELQLNYPFEQLLEKELKGKGAFTEEGKRNVADGQKDRVFTEEERRIISEAVKGRVVTEETRQKIGRANKGRKLTEETRQKMSESQKGRVVTEETRRIMGNAQKKRWARERQSRQAEVITIFDPQQE